MLEVSFEQIMQVSGAICASLTAAIGALSYWILTEINRLKSSVKYYQEQHEHQYRENIATQIQHQKDISAITREAARLEGRIEEMERLNPAEIARQIASIVTEILSSKV